MMPLFAWTIWPAATVWVPWDWVKFTTTPAHVGRDQLPERLVAEVAESEIQSARIVRMGRIGGSAEKAIHAAIVGLDDVAGLHIAGALALGKIHIGHRSAADRAGDQAPKIAVGKIGAVGLTSGKI